MLCFIVFFLNNLCEITPRMLTLFQPISLVSYTEHQALPALCSEYCSKSGSNGKTSSLRHELWQH